MEFKDEPAATATLSALTAKEDIVTAVLYKPDGKMFAHYFRTNAVLPGFLPSHLQEKGYRFEGGYLEVFQEVTLNGEHVGTLFLQSDMRQWSLRAKTLRKHPHHICSGLRTIRTVCLLEASRPDFKAHSAPGRHHANGFFKQELRCPGSQNV